MKPRITISFSKGGELDIWLNQAGRDLLVQELQHLSKEHDHFHFGAEESGTEVPVRTKPYNTTDRVVEWGKVMFRPDEWDAEYFPHVL
jgi:hypothetical protein